MVVAERNGQSLIVSLFFHLLMIFLKVELMSSTVHWCLVSIMFTYAQFYRDWKKLSSTDVVRETGTSALPIW